MAAARERRRARRVLRPDRCLRRPGRRPRRGLPVDRAGARAEAAAANGTAPARRRLRPRPTRRRRRPRPTTRRGGRRPRVTMRLVGAELVDSREILPGQWLQSFHAPDARDRLAGRAVRPRPDGRLLGLVLRRPFSINTADPATGHRSRSTSGRSAAARSGSPASGRATRSTCSGRSAGRSRSTPASRHLLLVAGGLGMAGVRLLADEAIRDGRQVTLLFGAAAAREVYPSSLLPDEVEYVIATDDGSVGHHGFVTELVPDYEAWADQAFACGPAPMLAALARLAAGRRRAARRGEARPEARRRARPIRSARRPPVARRSSRSRWSRTWAARSGRASAASSWASRARRSGSAARVRCSRPTRSPGRRGW